MNRERTRRRFLAALGSGAAALAGCAERSTVGERTSRLDTPAESPPPTEGDSNVLFVDVESGSGSGTGAWEDPLASFRHAAELVEPGDTIYARSGTYREWIIPERGGDPGTPITITGPPEAVLTSDERRFQPMQIRDSHVHVTGLTIDGLWDPDNPDDPQSYAEGPLVEIKPRPDSDEYLEDVVVAPHGIGNSYAHLVTAQRTKDLAIGPFEVTGLAGANYVLGDRDGHVGEVVYLGTPPSTYGQGYDDYPWNELDQTRNVRVHHVDNSAGHPHSELVNTKLGTRDVIVEYCTDGGSSQNADDFTAASVRLQSYDATVRWCDLRDGEGVGIFIGGGADDWLVDRPGEPPVDPEKIGTGHEVYGNRISGFGGDQIVLIDEDSADQLICGNDVTGATMGDPEQPCPMDLPEGDGVGSLGGDDTRTRSLRLSYLYHVDVLQGTPAGAEELADMDVEREVDRLGLSGDLRAAFERRPS